MAYATITDVENRLVRDLDPTEKTICGTLLEDIALIIDAYNSNASAEAKKVVSCRAIVRMLGDQADTSIPVGASEGSMSALGYSQSWKIGNGASGELYLTKIEKKLLGTGDGRIGSYSPLQELVIEETWI